MTNRTDKGHTDKGHTDKGTRGFELDIHVTFTAPLPEAEALKAMLVLDGFHVELYRPHPSALRPADGITPQVAAPAIPSARLTGPLHDPQAVRAGVAALLGGPARYLEVGLHGFLRSGNGYTEWMPWRRNVILPRHEIARIHFDEGVKYILE